MAKTQTKLDQYGSWVWMDPAKRASRMVLFVHGYTGDPESTWRRFPDLLMQAGQGFEDDFEIASFGYKTHLVANRRRIETIADLMLSFVDAHANSTREIYIVAHSLGGIVARQFLLRACITPGHRKFFAKVRQVHTVGTPSSGVWFVHPLLSRFAFFNVIARQLSFDSSYLSALRENYVDATKALRPRIVPPAIFKYVGDGDWVSTADLADANRVDSEIFRVVPASHLSIAKPRDSSETVYELITREIRAQCSRGGMNSESAGHEFQRLGNRGNRRPKRTPDRWLPAQQSRARELLELTDPELSILVGLLTLEAHRRPIGRQTIQLWSALANGEAQPAIERLAQRGLIESGAGELSMSSSLFDELAGVCYTDDPPGMPMSRRLAHLRERLRAAIK